MKEEDLNFEENQTIKPLYALILTPTRELAFQVRDHLVTAAKFTGLQKINWFFLTYENNVNFCRY